MLPRTWPKTIALLGLVAFFVFAGVSHFTNPEFFVAIVPAWMPGSALGVVYLSGVAEILGGLGALLPATRRLAGLWLIALLVAVYPANVAMALDPERWVAAGTPLWALFARLPFQFLFIVWAWWATRPDASVEEGAPWRG